MSDHLPEDLVRAEDIDTIMAGVCDEPCKVQDVASGCSCAMARQVVSNLRSRLAPNPHLDELTALSQEMGLYDASPALAPLREAGINPRTGRPCGHEYVRFTPGSTDRVCMLCGTALSSAQGWTAVVNTENKE